MTTSPALEKAMDCPQTNTDREIWREREGDYYADSIWVTEKGGVGLHCGGAVIVMPIRDWHRLASLPSGGDVARYRELAIQRITYTHDEHGTAKLSAALHLTQQALAEAAAALTASEAVRESERDARHKLEHALRAKDAAMQVLFDRLTAAGVDYSDLIP